MLEVKFGDDPLSIGRYKKIWIKYIQSMIVDQTCNIPLNLIQDEKGSWRCRGETESADVSLMLSILICY